jgi:phosphonate transport system substrate-binding protein
MHAKKFLPGLILLLGLAQPALAAVSGPIELGVFPYLSTRALLDLYQPVRLHLAAETGRAVNLFTATSFKRYADQTQQGVYDIVVTAPHFARLAQREGGYVPLAIYTREWRGIVVVAHDSPIQGLQDLKGKRIATPSQLALVTIMGRQLLRENGLPPKSAVTMLDEGSHNNAVFALQSAQADAAITERAALAQMPTELKRNLRVIAQTPPVPHVMYLAHPRLGQAEIKRIQAGLLNFPETAEGRAFLRDNGIEGMRPVNEADLSSMDPYLKELKHLLETTQP